MPKAADLGQFNVKKRADLTTVPRKTGDERTRQHKTERRLITKGSVSLPKLRTNTTSCAPSSERMTPRTPALSSLPKH